MIPNRLLDSGRIKAKSVFIITNVDNRHHINIVHDFNKYLKVRRVLSFSNVVGSVRKQVVLIELGDVPTSNLEPPFY